MASVHNPIIPGFNPDPSMICVGEDFYIATSTFEWVPGVQIHHSRDLIHWELITHPLKNIDLRGDRDSAGVWAPCLSWCDGVFYLVYSDVKMFSHTFYDVKNYLITATDICGPWSKPVFLHSTGFDASLFHDDDGRKWLLSMRFDYRTWKVRFAGIVMQEYSVEEKRLIGEPEDVTMGTPARICEAPHVYKRNGWYYLMCAEAGTEERHQETVWRSRSLHGPWELSPYHPLITALPYPQNPLQRSGHASLAQGTDGRWFLAHLCGRPIGPDQLCILGRETALQPIEWVDDWPRLSSGDDEPLVDWVVNNEPETTRVLRQWCDDFDGEKWSVNFSSLRRPLGDRASLSARPGWLRLYGEESLESRFNQTLLACRQQDHGMRAETKMDFSPVSYQQTAGLVYYYDTYSHFYACVTRDEKKGRVLTMMVEELYKFTMPLGVGVVLPENGSVWLRLDVDGLAAQFSYSINGEDYKPFGPVLNAGVMSDEYYHNCGQQRFTGAFVGICCQDLSGHLAPADFDYFSYQQK